MLSPASSSYSEDYWRDRCGMPPREEDFAARSVGSSQVIGNTHKRSHSEPRRSMLKALARLSLVPFQLGLRALARVATRKAARPISPVQLSDVRMGPARAMQASLQASLQAPAKRFSFPRIKLLKLSAVLVLLVWVAGMAVVYLHPAPANGGPLGEAYMSIAEALPSTRTADLVTRPADPNLQFDTMLVTFSDANEAALVALRGYLITGSDGFRSEWDAALDRLDIAQTAIEVDSHGWTDGKRLMDLRDMRKAVVDLKAQESLLAGLAVSTNRFPGLRLYSDETDKALGRAEGLIDETLKAVLVTNWAGAQKRVDTLAHIRGDLRNLRASLNAYLPSSARQAPATLMAEYASFKADLPQLDAMRDEVAPDDQARLDKVRSALAAADTQLQQILALKQTARWDYADFAFKQKAMPLSEKISSIIASWRTPG